MKRIIFLFLTAIIIISSSVLIYAHPGNTDSYGGHKSGNGYHYHHGYPAHDHKDLDGDGKKDCPYSFKDNTKDNSGSGSNEKTVSNQTESKVDNSFYIKNTLFHILTLISLYITVILFGLAITSKIKGTDILIDETPIMASIYGTGFISLSGILAFNAYHIPFDKMPYIILIVCSMLVVAGFLPLLFTAWGLLILLLSLPMYITDLIDNRKRVKRYLSMNEQDVFKIVLKDIKANGLPCYEYINKMKDINPSVYKYYTILAKKYNNEIFDVIFSFHTSFINTYSKKLLVIKNQIKTSYNNYSETLVTILSDLFSVANPIILNEIEQEVSSYLFFIYDINFYQYRLNTKELTDKIFLNTKEHISIDRVNDYANLHFNPNSKIRLLSNGLVINHAVGDIASTLLANIVMIKSRLLDIKDYVMPQISIIQGLSKEDKFLYIKASSRILEFAEEIHDLSEEFKSAIVEYQQEFKYFTYEKQTFNYNQDSNEYANDNTELINLKWYRQKHIIPYKFKL